MQFPCNGILLIQANLPRVILVFTLNYASFLIPYFNLLFSFIGNGLALSLIIFLLYRQPTLNVATLCFR